MYFKAANKHYICNEDKSYEDIKGDMQDWNQWKHIETDIIKAKEKNLTFHFNFAFRQMSNRNFCSGDKLGKIWGLQKSPTTPDIIIHNHDY